MGIHVDASAGSGNNQGMIQAEDAKLGEVKQETDYNKPLFETDYIATGNESGNRKKKEKAPKHLRKKSKKGNKYWWGGYGGWYGGWWYPYGGWWWKKMMQYIKFCNCIIVAFAIKVFDQ